MTRDFRWSPIDPGTDARRSGLIEIQSRADDSRGAPPTCHDETQPERTPSMTTNTIAPHPRWLR
jgi:hypothetical protein